MLTQAEIDALLAGAIEIEASNDSSGVNLAKLMGDEDKGKEEEGADEGEEKDRKSVV